MSPSEFDLRAALHDGEGDNLDVDRVVFAARSRVAERRMRVLSGAAIALVVAGAGVGGAFLARGSNSGTSHSNAGGGISVEDSAASARAAAPHKAATAGGGGARSAYGSAVVCPATMPRYLLPGGGSPGQFGASGPLFSKPVTSVVVCSYGNLAEQGPVEQGRRPGRLELGNGQAEQLAKSLENAPKRPTPTSCADRGTVNQLAIIGVAADGLRAGTVTARLGSSGCGSGVTNGTAVRYDWQPPSDLKAALLALKPTS